MKKTFILVLLISILSGEIVCRLFVNFKPFTLEWTPPIVPDFENENGPGLYLSHPYQSYRMKKFTGLAVQGTTQISKINFINGDGFRNNKEFPTEHTGIKRIVCLGSSTTYGVRNPYEETFPFLLEKYLNDHDPINTYEVINAGLVSSTTAEHIARLPQIIINKKPDIVVLYEGFNDLVPRIFNNFKSDYSHFRSYPKSSGSAFLIKMLNHSQFLRLISNSFFGQITLHDYIFNKINIPMSDKEKVDNFKTNTSVTFENNIELIIKLLKSYDINIILPTFAFTPLNNDYWIKLFPDNLWGIGISENNDVIRKLSTKYETKNPDLYEKFKTNPALFSGKIHFTKDGNQQIADEIGKSILLK